MLRRINNITFQPDYKTIFSRLGYKAAAALIEPEFKKTVISWIDEAADLIRLTGSAAMCSFAAEPGGIVIAGTAGKISIKSSKVSRLLSGCSAVLVMGVTAGVEIMDKIDILQKENMAKAVVFDAAAGEITDSGLDFIMSLYSRDLLRESKKVLSKRLSPGYSDFKIEHQSDIFTILELDKIGLKLNAASMLVPQKSVTAVTGIIDFRS